MPWFTKPTENIETAPGLTPLELYEQNRTELRALDQELAAAEKAIVNHTGIHKDARIAFINGDVFARINAMSVDPQLQALEGRRADVLRRWSANLAEGARLKKLCGLASY
jgi:hypothetical protein